MFKCFAAAGLLALLPFGALASSALPPTIEVPSAVAHYTVEDDFANLVAFGAPAIWAGSGYGDTLAADLALGFESFSPYADVLGYFTLSSPDSMLVSGLLSSIASEDSILTLVFSDLKGAMASAFGQNLIATLVFTDVFDADPLSALKNGERYEISYILESGPHLASIPLPTGGTLLASGIGFLALRRKFQKFLIRKSVI